MERGIMELIREEYNYSKATPKYLAIASQRCTMDEQFRKCLSEEQLMLYDKLQKLNDECECVYIDDVLAFGVKWGLKVKNFTLENMD